MNFHSQSYYRAHGSVGFTIVELLIVVVVIGVLAAISLVAYNGMQNRAHDTKRRADLMQVRKAIEAQYVVTGQYPLPDSGMSFGGMCISAPHWDCWGFTDSTRFIEAEFISAMPQDPSYNDNDACGYPNSFTTRAYYYAVTANRQGYTLGGYLETVATSDANYIAPANRQCGSFINWGYIKE